MKILYITYNLAAGGAEKLIESSLSMINGAEGISSDLLLLTDVNNVFDLKIRESGVKVEVVPFRKPINPVNILFIRNYIVNGKYDIVHVHLFPALYWTSLAFKMIPKSKKPRLIYTEHSTSNSRRKMKIIQPVEKFIYNEYNKIICVSKTSEKSLRNWLRKNHSFENDRFTVIETGANIELFNKAIPFKKAELIGSNENIKIICMPARFSYEKDHATLIHAMKYLDSNVFLLLVGQGETIERCKFLAKEIGIESKIKFLGFRSDIERIVKSSDIIVISSHFEGFSIAAIEAMAAGKPVIASDVSGLTEIVKGAGLLFPNGDAETLVSQIKKLIENPKFLDEITEKCFERAQQYSVQKMVDKYIDVYQSLID